MENLIYYNIEDEYNQSYIEQEFSFIKSMISHRRLKDIEWRNIHIPFFKPKEYSLCCKRYEIENKHFENLFYVEESGNNPLCKIISIHNYEIFAKKPVEIIVFVEETKFENNLNEEFYDFNNVQIFERFIKINVDIFIKEESDKKQNQQALQSYKTEFFHILKPSINICSQTCTIISLFPESKRPLSFFSLETSCHFCVKNTQPCSFQIFSHNWNPIVKPLTQVFQCNLRFQYFEIKSKLLCYLEKKNMIPRLCIDNSTFTSSPSLQLSECNSIEIQENSYSKENYSLNFDTKTIEQKVISIQKWWKGIIISRIYSNKNPKTPKFNGNIAKLLVTETFWHSVVPETNTKHSKSQDLNISSISAVSAHSIESKRGRRCKFNKAYVRNINALVPTLQKLINKHNKMGFWKLQSTMPKYLRRRYYSIQKGIKAIIGICITKPSNEAFEILKYLLYINTATPHHKLVKFEPELFEKYLHAINIQSVAKSYLKRKKYLLWNASQTNNESDLSSLSYESSILNQSKMNNSLQEFVNKSRAYRLTKTFNKIILRKRKDFMSSLFKFSHITKKINIYKMQKGLKIIGKYTLSALSHSFNNIKNQNLRLYKEAQI